MSRITTAAQLPKGMPRMECAVLIRPNSALHARLLGDASPAGLGWHGPIWGIYELDRAFSPAHNVRFGDGSGLTPSADELKDLILLGQIGTRELVELFD